MSEQQGLSMSTEGHWLPTATTANTPDGVISWEGIPRRGYSALVNGRCVGKIRYYPAHRHWRGSLDGWMWFVTPEMGAARFSIKETGVRHFKTRPEAQAAIERAWSVPRHLA